jgi:predicted  nucleic acid-binding Zn-ribbon protein
MSHEYYYQTVQREQEFLEEELHRLQLEKERLDFELQAVKNDFLRVVDYIQRVEKELGNVTNTISSK